MSNATAVEETALAHRIAAETGIDVRTALRAIRLGADALRVRRFREQVRPYVDAYRARTAGAVVAAKMAEAS